MRRIVKLSPETLSAEQRRLYAAITGGPRGTGQQSIPLVDSDGGLEGPFNAMLLQPAVGGALQSLGAAIRYQGILPPRTREMSILIVAAHWGSEFEWYAHEAAGRAVGLTEPELASLRAGQPPDLADPAELAAVRACRSLVRDADLSDNEYSDATAALGADGLFELTTLVGYYSMLALQLAVYRVGAPG